MLSHPYPLFSAELESAEALASSQQKFKTLNLADCNVKRHLLLMTLVCFSMCRGCMSSNPKLNSPSLATNDEMELDDLCPMTVAEVVEKPFRGQ